MQCALSHLPPFQIDSPESGLVVMFLVVVSGYVMPCVLALRCLMLGNLVVGHATRVAAPLMAVLVFVILVEDIQYCSGLFFSFSLREHYPCFCFSLDSWFES